jgi:chorismate mutase
MSETRGIRGATTVDGPRPELVTDAIGELLEEIERVNGFNISELAAAIFTLTDDLPGAAPAAVARKHGWGDVPLLQVLEHGGATGIPHCIRVLVLWNTRKHQTDVQHVYLRDAAVLRPEPVMVGGGTGRTAAPASEASGRKLLHSPGDVGRPQGGPRRRRKEA